MNFDASNVGDDSQLRRAVSGIGRSAEYSIAIALFAVCLVAGATLWFLNLREPGTVQMPPPPVALDTPTAAAPDEKATVEALQKSLDAKFDQIDQKRRVEEAAAERARQQVEAQAAREAAAQAAREAAAQAAAEEAERKARLAAAAKSAPKPAARAELPATATSPAPAAVQPQPVQPRIEAAAAAAVLPQPSRTEAAIDWSSCKRPPYPSESMKRMEEGTVTVKVDLDPTGKILASAISQSSGFTRLDGATMRAVGKCQFRAATVDGVPQASTAMVRIAWSLGETERFGR